jgi:hypothetical protein
MSDPASWPEAWCATCRGRGGRIDGLTLSRLEGGKLIGLGRWTGHDELCVALAAPVWDRSGSLARERQILGTVVWTTVDRRVVTEGRGGNERFEEPV